MSLSGLRRLTQLDPADLAGNRLGSSLTNSMKRGYL
jgi:hypothetical protein